MDFTGLGRFTAYKVNRPLDKGERDARLKQKQRMSVDPVDELSVIKVNSTYIELVDRWYASKGWSVIFAIMLAVPCLAGVIAFPILLIDGYRDPLVWIGVTLIVAFGCLFLGLAWYGFRLEAFRYTHYPIRLNRKTRQVHAFRPDGNVIEANWDKLFIFAGEGHVPAYGKTHDVRAHVLASDRKTVLDTFTLAYCYMGDKSSVGPVWEYIRRYMEEDEGVEKNWRYSDICMPVDGRREGLHFGIIRVFGQVARWPILQLLGSPIWSVVTLGRWIAMYTSRVPQWPENIETQYRIEPDDPYRRTWKDNVPFTFIEGIWPLICFIVGLMVAAWGLRAAFAGIFAD